jgi:membrane protein involved in colicin uptake
MGGHNAEMQKLRAENPELAARLKRLEENACATLESAQQQERLAAEKEVQQQLGALTRHIAEPEAIERLAAEQKNAEVAKVRAALEAALNAERAKANELARWGEDYLQEIGSLRERNREL